MTCYKPLNAIKSLCKRTAAGKTYITFDVADAGHSYEYIELPCGRCIGCRIERSRMWALRCVHEASLHADNSFVTLTFNDKHLVSNPTQTLFKKDFQLFMKRLRKHYVPKQIRYFHCGEYGEKLGRPHHHACLFGIEFADKYLWTIRNGVKLYRSETLEKLWPFGYCTIGDVTWESAAYVARYVTKKITGDKARAHYCRVDQETGEMSPIVPEYITMSRRPGLAAEWAKNYSSDVYPKDFVTHLGKKFRPPRYYDQIYDKINPDNFIDIKKKRLTNAEANADNNTRQRLLVREEVQRRKSQRLIRSYENGYEDVYG